MKKQRQETSKENKDLKERMDALEKEARSYQHYSHAAAGSSHSHSRDSAIDSDLQEAWETENISIDVVSDDGKELGPNEAAIPTKLKFTPR